ncbi:MAG: T9SS type A sorting domain-containing protein [Luteibaculaceae bacterium]
MNFYQINAQNRANDCAGNADPCNYFNNGYLNQWNSSANVFDCWFRPGGFKLFNLNHPGFSAQNTGPYIFQAYPSFFKSNPAGLPGYQGLPNNSFGFQEDKYYSCESTCEDGAAYAGITAYFNAQTGHNRRSYSVFYPTSISPNGISTLDYLTPGEYVISIDVNLADRSKFASNKIGIFFYDPETMFTAGGALEGLMFPEHLEIFGLDNGIIHFAQGQSIVPQVVFEEIVTDKDNWVTLTATFTLDQNLPGSPNNVVYSHAMIGVFEDETQLGSTLTAQLVSPNETFNGAFYYIDNIEIRKTNQLQVEYNSLELCDVSLPFTASGMISYKWYHEESGMLLSTEASYTVSPSDFNENFTLKLIASGHPVPQCNLNGSGCEYNTPLCFVEEFFQITIPENCCSSASGSIGDFSPAHFYYNTPNTAIQGDLYYGIATWPGNQTTVNDWELYHGGDPLLFPNNPELDRIILNNNLRVSIGNLHFKDYKYVLIKPGNRIIVEAGATLTLEGNTRLMNACNSAWGGILVKEGGTLVIKSNIENGQELSPEIRNALIGIEFEPGANFINTPSQPMINFPENGWKGLKILNCGTGIYAYGLKNNYHLNFDHFITILHSHQNPTLANDPFYSGFIHPNTFTNSKGIHIFDSHFFSATNNTGLPGLKISGYSKGVYLQNANATFGNIAIEKASHGIDARSSSYLRVFNSTFFYNRFAVNFQNPIWNAHLEVVNNGFLPLPANQSPGFTGWTNLNGFSPIRPLSAAIRLFSSVNTQGGMLNNYGIHHNKFTNYQSAVSVSNFNNAKITNNLVSIQPNFVIHGNNPSIINRNSSNLIITENEFTFFGSNYNGGLTSSNALEAIYIFNGSQNYIAANTMNSYTRGIHSIGNNMGSILECNVFNDNLRSVELTSTILGGWNPSWPDPEELTAIIGGQTNGEIDFIAGNNQFNNNVSPFKVFGSTSISSQWLTKNTSGFLSISPYNVTNLIETTVQDETQDCTERDLTKSTTKNIIPSEDSEILLDIEENLEYFDYLKVKNIEPTERIAFGELQKGYLYDLNNAIAERDTLTASTLLTTSFASDTEIEEIHFNMLQLAYQLFFTEDTLSVSQREYAENVACLDLFYYGPGVLTARNILEDYDINCDNSVKRSGKILTTRNEVKLNTVNPKHIKVFPNPTSSKQINLDFTNFTNESTNLEFVLSDIRGKILLNGRVKPNLGIETLNLGNLSEGLYILQLFDQNQKQVYYEKVLLTGN